MVCHSWGVKSSWTGAFTGASYDECSKSIYVDGKLMILVDEMFLFRSDARICLIE